MWVLQSSTSDRSYSFLVGVECVVGRKGCPILINNDQSISRKHAAFNISHTEANLGHPDRPPTITLKDSSKYGTIINKSKLEANGTTSLKHGDEIQFGSLGTNSWRIEYRPLVCACSALSSADKKLLKLRLLKLGGHYVSNWSKECTHLVMSAISVTVKVICALVSCCPVVTLEYLSKLTEAAETHSSIPDSSKFMPDIIENNIHKIEVSFHPNPVRRTVFKDKTFIFLTEKKYKSLSTAVLFGGGKCILMAELTNDVAMLTQPGTCVVLSSQDEDTQAGVASNQQWASRVVAILDQKGLRSIQDQEVGLAVLYCSTQLHCNPAVSQSGHNLMQAPVSQSLNTQVILAHETQTPEQGMKRAARTKAFGERSVIDETRFEKPDNKKRNREDDEHCQSPSKMQRVETKKHGSNGSAPLSTPHGNKTIETLKPTLNMPPELTCSGNGHNAGDKNTKKTSKQGNLKSFLQPLPKSSETKALSDVETEIQNEMVASIPPVESEPKTMSNKDASRTSSKPDRKRKSRWLDVCDDTTTSVNVEDARESNQSASVIGESARESLRDQDVTHESLPTENKRSRKETDDSDNTGLWKKKIKVEPTFQVESLTAGCDEEDQPVQPRLLPGGYISVQAQNSIKSSPDSIKPEEDDLPISLIKTNETSLIHRRANGHRNNGNDQRVGLLNVKNFKRFKKGLYPGQQGMPRVIGGNDLYTHYNKVQEDAAGMFREIYQAEEEKDQLSQVADSLFGNIPAKIQRR